MSENAVIEETASEEIIDLGEESEEINQEQLTPQEKKRINSLKYKFNGKEYEEKLPLKLMKNMLNG